MSVTFFADAGQIMVGARVACYTFGRFNVTLPEGKELATDEYDEGYTDGYLYRPPEHIHFDDFDFGFVQADVEVDVNAQWSDFEAVIDEAQKKVSEDVYFDADIEGPGLGRYKFGQHYRIGDIVRVGILGGQRYVTAPVTQVTHLPNGNPRVHVGGQAIRDLGLVEEQNRQVHQAIARAAAQNRHQLSQVASTASQAEKKIDQVLENIPDPTLFETYIQETEEAVLSAQDFAAKAIAAADEADALNVGMAAKLSTVAGYVQDAAGHVADAEASAAQVHGYLADGREILAQTDALKTAADNAATAASKHADDALLAVEESRLLTLQNQQSVGQISRYVANIAGLVGNASASAAQAFAYLDESRVLRESTRVFMEQAEGAVESAQGYVSQAEQIMDEADQVLESGKQFRDQAQTAKTGAETALVQAQGTLEQVVTKHGEVLTWHQEMLAAHDETLSTHELVLKLHASGIRAASAAASQASAAVSAQGVVLQLHGQILELHEDAIEYATQTAVDASKAAGEAGKAIEAQKKIEEQQVLIDQKQDAAIASAAQSAKDAASVAAVVKEISTLHAGVLEKHDGAIAAATQTGLDAAAAAADAASAAVAVRDAQAIQVDINTKLAAGVRWAGMAAAQAAAATQSLASAVEEVDKATILAQQTADDALRSAKSAEDAGKIRDAFVKANNDAIWLVNFRALRKTTLEVPIDVRKDYPLGSLGGLSLGILKVYDSSGRNYLDFEYPDWQGAVSILIKPVWREPGGSGYWTEIENRTPDTSSTTSVGLSRRDNWPPQNATHFRIEIELSPIWPRDERYQAYFASNKITDPVTGQVVPLA